MPDLSQFPLKKGVSLLNSGFTPLRTIRFCIFLLFVDSDKIDVLSMIDQLF